MKHVDLFNEFMRDVVNLNDTRVTLLEKSIESIKQTVRDSLWKPKIKEWVPQGSWAHKTIIKPVDQGAFDADLLVFVHPVEGWSAATYIEELYEIFKGHGTYKDKVRRWSHCVTVTYANERKIDIAPCVVNRLGTRLEVCNRNTDEFELTEPKQYTAWLIEKNGYSGSDSFRKVTRLIKYLRDIKTRFTCSSVLLTTLLGYRITELDQYDDDAFADLPTALKTVFGRLDDWLQVHVDKPQIINPFLQSEDFIADLTQEQYDNLRERIHAYREWIDEAFNESDRSESIAKWRRVFGEDFASGVVVEAGKSVSRNVVAEVRRTLVEATHFTGDLVDAIKRFGARILPVSFQKKPYMEAPRWKRTTNQNVSVSVRANLHRSKLGTQPISIQSLDPLPPGYWLHFKAVTNTGLPLDTAYYRVMWRVTNTDEEAAREGALRGRFEDPENDNSRWEQLKYRGVHMVEAFVIRKRDDLIVGQSGAFLVMIE